MSINWRILPTSSGTRTTFVKAALRPESAVALAVLMLLVGGGLACSSKSNLPDYGAVPDFHLIDSYGRAFASAKELKGDVWVADFIYTNCPGPCPRMTSIMHQLQKKVVDDQDVRLVSISVDPDRDTPAVMAAYAKNFQAPMADWFFLTGDRATIHLLAHDVFHVGDLISVMDHSTHFVLVDKRCHIRGYYSTFGADDMPKLFTDLRQLRKESA